MSRAVLALGTNLGDREENLKVAMESIALLPGTEVLRTSYVYETEPVGLLEQPPFLNAAVLIETALSPRALLGACLGIEAAFGRIRSVRKGPRVLDIDVLAYENEISSDEELTLPHPRICERAFVLVPLQDLFPDGSVFGKEYAGALARVGIKGVVKYKTKRLESSDRRRIKKGG